MIRDLSMIGMLLGMKGTFSELELSDSAANRSQEALRLKAARGDLHTTVAIGYLRGANDPAGTGSRSPDPRSAVFGVPQVRRDRQACASFALWLRQERIDLPIVAHCPQGLRRGVAPAPLQYKSTGLLTHPVYGGAYVFGRSPVPGSVRRGGAKAA